jgi:hypothetical protein
VYVSGISEMKTNAPFASVVAVAVCDGELTVTRTPGIPCCVSRSTTLPRSPPVVPANADPKEQMARTAASRPVAMRLYKKASNAKVLGMSRPASWKRCLLLD